MWPWNLGPHLPRTLLLSIKPTLSKTRFQALLLELRVGLGEIQALQESTCTTHMYLHITPFTHKIAMRR